MTEVLTATQMREIEQAAMASGAVTGLELMEQAGAGVITAAIKRWPELSEGSHRALVLCGPGNNGGDGFVIARLLKRRGWDVSVLFEGEGDALPVDAKANHDRWCAQDVTAPLSPAAVAAAGTPDLLIDALFGTGLSRPLDAETRAAIAAMHSSDTAKSVDGADPERSGGVRRVSVDIPSGLSSETGWPVVSAAPDSDAGSVQSHAEMSSACFHADLTVTFHAPKVGHYLAMGPEVCGRLVTAPLKPLPPETRAADRITLIEPVRDGRQLPVARYFDGLTKSSGHKFAHGHLLVLSGGVGRGGAARLAARGALRIGAGLVTVACPPVALIENAAQLDAIMLRGVKDSHALSELLQDDRLTAVCLGPGLGLGAREAGLVAAVLRAPHATCVTLDGDALTLMAKDADLFAALHDRCVLTPHGGEFARLFPDIAARLEAAPSRAEIFSKVDATRAAAARAGCVVLFKGPDTVIADPDGRCSIHAAQYDREVPWIATAGSGDVLAGFISGLLARGFEPMRAAETAAWLHVECARGFGPGLIAEDLPEELPKVFREVGL